MADNSEEILPEISDKEVFVKRWERRKLNKRPRKRTTMRVKKDNELVTVPLKRKKKKND